MPTHDGYEVTVGVVDRLWLEAIDGSRSLEQIHHAVEELLTRVSPESPVVNWGMTDLHILTRPSGGRRHDLAAARTRWLVKVAEYEEDPTIWMRDYFVNMAQRHAERFGPARGRAFAALLLRSGHVTADDFPAELRPD
jgi:hypothetical protein